MYSFLAITLIIVCALTILIVLIQNPKGGGIAANFSNIPTQLMGVKKSSDFIEKATWGCAIAILLLTLSIGFTKPETQGEAKDTRLKEQIDNLPAPKQQPAPVAPAPAK
ncbi:MAG: preprotein translocase subunit SecG [Bacteroidetes bacterium]|nr:preprotein translocase subunit SecG [Bacteroidota bacterium]